MLRTIWDIASATSCWPVYLEVARRLARKGTLDLANVLQRLNGRRLVGFNKPLRDSSIIGLSVAGAAACPVPDEVLSAFLAIVKAAGERSPNRVPGAPSHMSTETIYYMSLETFYDGEDRVPPVSVTDRDFTDDAGLRGSGCSRLLQLVLLLLRSEDLGLESFSGPNADGHWSASFDPLSLLFSARDRRGEVVENLDDYVSKRQEHSMLFRLTEDEERKASLIANLGLLADELSEWIYDEAAGSVTNVVSCEQFRPDIDPWIIDEVLHRLTSENRISLAAADSMQALPHVLLTEDSVAQVEKSRAAQVEKSRRERAAQVEKSRRERAAQVEKSRRERAAQVEKSRREKNRAWRDHAGRNALLAFVHEKKAEITDVIHLPQDFLGSPRSAVAGDYFSEADVLAASHYLQDKGLVRGDKFQITHLTDRGYDCIEQGGDVAKYSHHSEGSGTDIRISNPQGVIINSPKSVQNNFSAGIDMRDLLKFAGFVRQIESTLGLAEGEQTELEAQAMELHEVASSPAPEAGRLRRLANRILRILGTAAPTVASQMAIELGDKALRALGA